MAGTDRDGQRVAACTGSEVNHLLGFGVVANLRSHLILNAGKHTELALNGHIILVGILYHLTRDLNILLVGK